MKLEAVDKELYRKRLKFVIISFIAVFAGSSLLFGQLLIFVFSDQNNDNFSFNLFGVILGLGLTAGFLAKFKRHELMTEVYYVWQLKQVMNRIYRKLSHIKELAKQDNVDALIILNYYYELCQKIYKLDDNTITLTSVVNEHNKIIDQISSLNLDIKVTDFNEDLLKEL